MKSLGLKRKKGIRNMESFRVGIRKLNQAAFFRVNEITKIIEKEYGTNIMNNPLSLFLLLTSTLEKGNFHGIFFLFNFDSTL